MKAENEPLEDPPFDEANERLVGQALHAAYAAPAMSGAFVERLSRRLDEEFELAASLSFNGVGSHSVNGVGESCGSVPLDLLRPKRRPYLRVLVTVAAAAALLIGIGLWNDHRAYGWANMLQALERCEWVQAITRSVGAGGEQAAIGWFSSGEQVAAREAGEARVFVNFQSRTVENFDPAERVIHQQGYDTSTEPATAFLALLFEAGESTALARELELVEETWKKGAEGQVNLLVTLKSNGELHHLKFAVDEETHLPVSGHVTDENEEVRNEIEFSYPRQGPESIFALGISPEVKVVVSNAEESVGEAVAIAKTAPGKAAPVAGTIETAAGGETLAVAEEPTPKLVVEKLIVGGESKEPGPQPPADTAPQGATDVGAVAAISKEMEEASQRVARNEVQFAPLPKLLSEAELVEKVNTLLADFWQSQGITPAEPASDTEFLRRVYLDLTGRIPTVSEVYAFLEDPREDRRMHLIEDLLSRRDHATHLAAVWRSVLLPEGVDLNAYGGTNTFDKWLADRFGENLPYDEIVRQLLLAEGRVSESGPILFYASLKLNPEEIAAKTSRVFLGTRMECAQCHDHPFDEQISQKDFWGFAAHFAQISRPQGKMEMTSSVLRVHDSNFGEVMLPDTDTVVPPHLPGTAAAETVDHVPTGMAESRRRQLVAWLTDENNDRFARAGVNRVWQQLFGRGLVEPVDDMRPDNAPVCPEVLGLLARDFAASEFDLRRLLRALVLTDAYQLSSGTAKDDPSQALCFARMNMKNFSADQLYDCISVATRNESSAASATGEAVARTNNMSRQAFIEQFRTAAGDRTDYQAGVPQALTLMHGTVVHSATDLKSSGLLKSLNAPFFTDEQRLETLFLATLSREPEDAESEKLLAYLESAKKPEEKLGILGDVLWALLNSAEFTFIH